MNIIVLLALIFIYSNHVSHYLSFYSSFFRRGAHIFDQFLVRWLHLISQYDCSLCTSASSDFEFCFLLFLVSVNQSQKKLWSHLRGRSK